MREEDRGYGVLVCGGQLVLLCVFNYARQSTNMICLMVGRMVASLCLDSLYQDMDSWTGT